MKTSAKIAQVKRIIRNKIKEGEKIGFVPTMGYLHEGHLSLVKKSLKDSTYTVVSIFVNPTQFSPGEDLNRYPRDVKRDLKLLKELSVDLVFIPDANEMYSTDHSTSVLVSDLMKTGEGKSRPGHFEGVLTVVAKLLNIITPDDLYLGQKDIQQAVIIKKMISDLNFSVKVKICSTIREKDGLAMSSRNVYLSEDQRSSALALYSSLKIAAKEVRSGNINCSSIRSKMKNNFGKFKDASLEYILFADIYTFENVNSIKTKTAVAISGKIGSIRLIDNITVNPENI